jgi:hypothetical protein
MLSILGYIIIIWFGYAFIEMLFEHVYEDFKKNTFFFPTDIPMPEEGKHNRFAIPFAILLLIISWLVLLPSIVPH